MVARAERDQWMVARAERDQWMVARAMLITISTANHVLRHFLRIIAIRQPATLAST